MMFFGGASGRRNLPQHPAQRKLLLFWCWLYASMGIACAGLGTLVLADGSLLTHGRPFQMDNGIRMIAAILIVFGILRIANSVYHIRRLRRMR